MEELESSSDSDTDSEGYSKQVEEELYSVLHYNDFSQGIPSELLDKYSISTDSKNEFVISLKSRKNAEANAVEDLTNEAVSGGSSDSSSEDDIVVVDTDNPNKSRPGVVTPSSSKNKGIEEVVIDESSDSDGGSSVQIIEMSRKRKHSGSSVISLSSGDENLDFSINTTGGDVYDSDGNVSDVVEKASFKWSHVASPKSWTKEMRKYYNSTCDRLRYFDHKKIRQEIKKGGPNDWFISPRDLYPENRRRPRCDICRQSDHLARNCPKQNPTCHMCGVEGHSNQECPNSICLQCGTKNNQFTVTCRHCTHMKQRPCFNCNQRGHESKFCPEKWREFHSTTDGPVSKPVLSRSGPFLCCNCGAANHSYEECNQQYLSTITKSLPAYDWLHGKRTFDDWRYNGLGGRNRGNWRAPPKRPRFSNDSHGYFRGNRSNEPDFTQDDMNGHLPSLFFQPPIPAWYLNRSQAPRKSNSLKRKDRRRKNITPGVNFRNLNTVFQ